MPSATTVPAPPPSPKSIKQYPRAKQAQQANLQSYIPFGTFTLKESQFLAPFLDNWRELEAAELAASTEEWSSDLALLVHTAWCRAFAKVFLEERIALVAGSR